MPRTYKSKNVQTKKEMSGEKNMPKDYIEKHQDASMEDGLMENLIDIFDSGCQKKKKGCNWTEEDLETAIREYFTFCGEKTMKPSKSGLTLWLGCSKSQYYAWQTETGKYGVISNLISMANTVIENQYINKLESYPTGNIFMLKASHGYAETSKIEVTGSQTTANDVADAISKLGLDSDK